MVNNDVKQLKNMAENIQRKEELISKLNSSKELFKNIWMLLVCHLMKLLNVKN